MQNLTIDYSTDKGGRILSAAYNETGGFSGNLTFVYDNFGNVAAEEDDDGDMAKELGKGTLIGEVLNKLGLSSVAGLIGLAISIIEQAVKSILADRNIRSAAQRCTDETINRCKKWGCSEPGGAGAI
ncbi:MAG: hypothetical protein PHQ76_05855 [Caldisericia bacterium]|nr:hypothetical protein [Caldisericia bacterium]